MKSRGSINNQKYCSAKCSTKKYLKPKTIYDSRDCSECGKIFSPTASNQIYCDTNCRAVATKKAYEIKRGLSVYRIFERDGFQCAYCGKSSYGDKVKLLVDHIYPRKYKGDNSLFNLITVCENCNQEKGYRVMPKETLLKIWNRTHLKNQEIQDFEQLKEEVNKLWQTNDGSK